jgi:hypothetical protein
MGKILLVVAIAVLYWVVPQEAKAGDTLNPCWKLIWEDKPETGYENPDSVMYDSCKCPTKPLDCYYVFAKKYFDCYLPYGALLVPQVPRDSVILKTWRDIDTSFTNLRTELEKIEIIFGKFYFQKIFPDIIDSSSSASRYFYIFFEKYQNIYDVDSLFIPIKELYRFRYYSRLAHWLSKITEELPIKELTLIKINSDRIEVQIPEEIASTHKRINIFNCLGETILSRETENKTIVQIDISNYNYGVYFIQINDKTYKFIK